MSDKDEAAPVFVDGVEADEAAKVSKGNDLKVSELKFTNSPVAKCNVGNGTLVEAYLDEDTNDVTIVAISRRISAPSSATGSTRTAPPCAIPETGTCNFTTPRISWM